MSTTYQGASDRPGLYRITGRAGLYRITGRAGLYRIIGIFWVLLCCRLFAPIAEAQTRTSGSQLRILANIQTGTSYTVSLSDCGQLLSFSNPGPITVSLPQPGTSGLGAGCWLEIQNTGAATLTLVPNQSTVDGSATLQLLGNQGLRLISTGARYLTERGSQAGIGQCVLSGAGNDQLSCRSVSSNDAAVPGQISLFDLGLGGEKYFGWGAPPVIQTSYTAQVPASQPNGQVMQFSAPSGQAALATGEWITLGSLATQDAVLPSQLPLPTASTLGGVQSKDCSSIGMLQRINTDGSVTCGAGGGGGSGTILTTAIWAPFGLTSGTATVGAPRNGAIVVAKVKVDSATTIGKFSYEFAGNAHSAVAIYSDTGNLLAWQSAGTAMCGGCVQGLALSAPYTASQGVYYMALSTDSSGSDVIGVVPGGVFLNPDVAGFATYTVATAANTVSWSTGVATWPAALGILTKNNNCPMFVIGY